MRTRSFLKAGPAQEVCTHLGFLEKLIQEDYSYTSFSAHVFFPQIDFDYWWWVSSHFQLILFHPIFSCFYQDPLRQLLHNFREPLHWLIFKNKVRSMLANFYNLHVNFWVIIFILTISIFIFVMIWHLNAKVYLLNCFNAFHNFFLSKWFFSILNM